MAPLTTGVRARGLAAVADGAERPAGITQLQQQKSLKNGRAHVLVLEVAGYQQRRAGQTHYHAENGRTMERAPPGIAASMPTSQKGQITMMSAARPLGISVSARTSVVLAPPSSRTPVKAVIHSSRPDGRCVPKARADEHYAA